MNDMVGRRGFLKGMGFIGAGALAAGLIDRLSLASAAVEQGNIVLPLAGELPLCRRAAAKGLFYGAATTRGILSSDAAFASKFIEECNMLVPEGELKWNALRPTPTGFKFDTFDWFMDFTRRNHMLFRGHTLVWHEALPPWFKDVVNGRNAEQFLLDHIKTVVGRHAGEVHSWDVVNEVVAVWDKRPDGLRDSPWLKLMGPRYIELAFKAANDADPKALLVLNQNHLELDDRGNNDTRRYTFRLLEDMKQGGVPVHALGIQAHLGGKGTVFNGDKFRNFLRDVADLDLKIIITEMDVADDNLPASINERDRLVAGIYEDFLSVALAEKAVIGVMTWGLSDKYTWLAKHAPRDDGLPVRTLPLDANLNRKPAWAAIAQAFDNALAR